MTRDQLEHAIRAACEVAEDSELIIFGSQAILGEYPNAPERLRASIEVDVQPLNRPSAVDLIDGALGELSQFHETYGFYVHGVSIEAATLPNGWEDRTIPVSHPTATRGNVGHCLDAHDLAASKLVAFREKDREFVRTLLAEGLISAKLMAQRISELGLEPEHADRLARWVTVTAEELT